MLQARLQLDGASYSALVTALVAGNNVSLAQDLSRDTSRTSLRRESFNKILNGFALRGDDASIRQIMLDMRERKLSPDVVSYNTLLKALKRHKTTCLEVPTFLEEMKLCTVQPNHVTFSSLMSLAAKFADARSVEDLIQRAKSHGVEIGTFAFNSLISAHIKVSDLQSAHAEVKRMQKENLDPDVVTYTTMMKGQREEVVLDLLEDMRNNIVKPNSVSFTTLLSSLTRAQQVTAALEIARNVHQEANATGSPISSHLACAILHVCAKAAEQSEQPHKVVGHSSLSTLASQVFQLVKKPDAACRNAFSAVSKAKESGREIQQQKRV
jgi:pentatricopeptide repeat protein